MIIRDIIKLASEPEAGMLFGVRGNQAIIDHLNEESAFGSMVFGSDNDPFADRANLFNRLFVNIARDTEHLLEKTASWLFERDVIIRLKEKDDLAHVPVAMHMPILTYAPIRKLFEDGQIDGWGHEIDELPDDNIWDRVINNGYIGIDPLTGELPEFYEWEKHIDDPEYTLEELNDLMEARQFIDEFILEQLSDDGDMIDPTNYLDGGTILKESV